MSDTTARHLCIFWRILLNKDPEAVKKIVQQAFSDANIEVFSSLRDYFQSFGGALALSNDGAKQGLGDATQRLQKAGFSILDALNAGKNLFDQGIDAGGKASQVLLNAVRLAAKTGFAGCYHRIRNSVETGYQALQDAKNSPIQKEAENQNCEVDTQDPEGSEAVKQINQAESNALERGANAQQVERFTNVVQCALGDIVKATAEGKQTMEEMRTIIETDPEGAKKIYAEQAEAVKKVVHSVTARISLILGDVALKTGSELRDEIGPAILALETGKVLVFLGLDAAGSVIGIGTKYQGDAPMVAVDAASQSIYYAKNAYIQGVVKAAKLVLSVL